MTWTAVKEEELRQAKQSAGWRWIAYFLTFVGLVAGLFGAGIVSYFDPDAFENDPKGVLQVVLTLAGLILLMAIFLDLPAEKAAKKAKLLQAEKREALST